MSQRLTAIIIHWNQGATCLDTVARFQELHQVESVIVVDNGSRRDELTTIRNGLPNDVDLIEVGFNSGFGPAANRGWERWLSDFTGTEWSAIAPHDAYPTDDSLRLLLDAARDRPRVGLLSADVGDDARPVVDHVFGPITAPATSTAGFESVDYPHGTLMLASRTCLEDIGLFDERYFAYCEEADLGLRAKDAGYEVGLVRGARVINPQVNTPTAIVDYLKERNTVLLLATHFGVHKAAMRFVIAVWQLADGVVRPSQRGEYWHAGARRRALVDVVTRSWGPPPASVTESV